MYALFTYIRPTCFVIIILLNILSIKKSVSFPIVLYTIGHMAISNIFKYTSTFKKCALKVDEKFPH